MDVGDVTMVSREKRLECKEKEDNMDPNKKHSIDCNGDTEISPSHSIDCIGDAEILPWRSTDCNGDT